MTIKEFEEIIDNARQTNISKSIRRVIFTTTDEEEKEKGRFFVSCMSGKGTCIIIKYNHRFFAITAKHVLKDTKDQEGNYINESPFWMPTQFNKEWKSLHDFFMPKKLWKINELINEEDRVLLDDILMIELYPPHYDSFPDYYLDLDEDENLFLKKEEFFNGQYLIISGYPHEKNSFDWNIEHPNSKMTHATSIHRYSILGEFIKNEGVGYISFDVINKNVTHDETNGMSGGIIYNLQPNPENTKVCGMILTSGNNMCNFLPSYIMEKAIRNYKNASFEIIDPAEYSIKEPTTEEDVKRLDELMKLLNRTPK